MRLFTHLYSLMEMKKKFYFSTLSLALLLIISCGGQKKLARQKHTYMKAAYTELKEAVNEAEVTILNDTVKVLFPEHLLFKKNYSTIEKENFPLMERFANALNKYNKTSILINGYTDKTGGDQLNEKLSQNRADSAKNVLQNFKVVPERMYTWGLGVKNPIADNNTEEGRRKNRRVEFIILYAYEPEQAK